MTNTTTPTRPLVLSHNQQVTFDGARYQPEIRVFDTVQSVRDEHGDKPAFDYWLAISIRNSRQHRSDLVTSIQSAAVLTADYPGKSEELAEKARRYEAAPVLREGQFVEIGGKGYRVRIARNPHGAADPIHFERMIDEDDGDQYSEAAENLAPLSVEEVIAAGIPPILPDWEDEVSDMHLDGESTDSILAMTRRDFPMIDEKTVLDYLASLDTIAAECSAEASAERRAMGTGAY